MSASSGTICFGGPVGAFAGYAGPLLRGTQRVLPRRRSNLLPTCGEGSIATKHRLERNDPTKDTGDRSHVAGLVSIRGLSVETGSQAERDGHWVEMTLAGDREAFGRLVERYQQRIFAMIFRTVRNQADTADLTQRTFVTAFAKLPSLRRKQTFAAWLFRIATNLTKNHIRFRAKKAFETLDDVPLSSSPQAEERLLRESRRRALREALTRLPEKQRLAISLRIDGDLTFREIGEVIGSSEVSARVNYHHGLKALRRMLKEPTASEG